MQWLKHVTVDLITTIVIAIVVFLDETEVLEYVLYTYTVLMVLARSFTLFSSDFRQITRKKVSQAPDWIYHTLYALNVLFLAWGAFFLTAAAWVFIWGVAAYISHRKEL
ncbi:MAG: hypothetical protein EA391_07185 [Balneolaceae bacterium]|nr:MAG: hypothetical protein EA391_07185 [Balneolaceae bacterium]